VIFSLSSQLFIVDGFSIDFHAAGRCRWAIFIRAFIRFASITIAAAFEPYFFAFAIFRYCFRHYFAATIFASPALSFLQHFRQAIARFHVFTSPLRFSHWFLRRHADCRSPLRWCHLRHFAIALLSFHFAAVISSRFQPLFSLRLISHCISIFFDIFSLLFISLFDIFSFRFHFDRQLIVSFLRRYWFSLIFSLLPLFASFRLPFLFIRFSFFDIFAR